MTDQGYSVYWEATNDLTGRVETYHRKFTTLEGANEYRETISALFKPRMFENKATSDEERDTVARDTTDHLNRRALVELMLKYDLTIPTKQFDMWRPTKRACGAISGLHTNLEIIATDGLLAWFLTPEGDVWSGHIQCFDGKVEPLHGATFTGTMTKKPKTLTKKERVRILLDNL